MVKPGDVISNETLRREFSVGNMGGMRKSNKRKLLVIVSDNTKGLYVDRWEGNVLHYTGMGKNGDQVLRGNQNQTLNGSESNGIAVHLFEVFEPGKYIYAGEVELVGKPYQEEQEGEDKRLRQVWMFPLSLKTGAPVLLPPAPQLDELDELKQKTLAKLLLEDLKKRATRSKAKTARRQAKVDQFVRDPYVAAYVKKAAAGKCDLCAEPAPFEKDGTPYFHCHHVQWLARGGPDIIQNAVALCPNCHCRMHELDRRADMQKLADRMKARDPELEPIDLFAKKPKKAA